MVDENESETIDVREAAKKAVESSENIHDDVRDITLKALSKHHLDIDRIKSVIKATLEGAQAGVGANSNIVRESLTEVIAGLDTALETSAQATRLAIEETTGKIHDFNHQDLKRALDDLAGLEDLFLDTIREVGHNGKAVVKNILNDLEVHIKNSGTAVGHRAATDISQLREQLERTTQQNVSAVSDSAKSFSTNIARVASGLLAGMAETIKESEKESKSEK